MHPRPTVLAALAVLMPTFAFAQVVTVPPYQDVRDRVTLTKAELDQLLPKAAMTKMNEKGNTHRWRNEPSGNFVISSDSLATQGVPSTSLGSWRISDDGRYCLHVDWKRTPTEDWCRLVVRAGGAYYAVKPDKSGAEKLFRLDVGR